MSNSDNGQGWRIFYWSVGISEEREENGMSAFLIILGVVAAIYIYGAIGLYQSSKHFPV